VLKPKLDQFMASIDEQFEDPVQRGLVKLATQIFYHFCELCYSLWYNILVLSGLAGSSVRPGIQVC